MSASKASASKATPAPAPAASGNNPGLPLETSNPWTPTHTVRVSGDVYAVVRARGEEYVWQARATLMQEKKLKFHRSRVFSDARVATADCLAYLKKKGITVSLENIKIDSFVEGDLPEKKFGERVPSLEMAQAMTLLDSLMPKEDEEKEEAPAPKAPPARGKGGKAGKVAN